MGPLLKADEASSRKTWLICGTISVLFLGGFGYLTWADSEAADEALQAARAIEGQIAQANAGIDRIPGLEDEVLVLRDRVKRYVEILPDDEEINSFVDTLTRFASGAGVAITSLDDTDARARSIRSRRGPQEAFERLTYKLGLLASADSLLRFLDAFENGYERFVRVPAIRVRFRPDTMGQERVEGPRMHLVDLDIETYVYNGAGHGQHLVQIPSEERKLERLAAAGRLGGSDDSLDLGDYALTPAPERRDPFTDPRANGGGSDRLRREEEGVLTELTEMVGRLERLVRNTTALDTAPTDEDVRARDELFEELREAIRLCEQDGVFTIPELASGFRTRVVAPFERLAAGGSNGPAMTSETLAGKLALMREAAQAGQWQGVSELYKELEPLTGTPGLDTTLKVLLAEATRMAEEADARVTFTRRELKITGTVCFEDDPSRAVAIIDDKTYRPGEAVGEDLTLLAVTPAGVEFLYRGYEMCRRYPPQGN